MDTSTSRGSVAVLDDGGAVLLDEVFTADRSHTSALYPILQRALAIAPKPRQIAVGTGPGSYAGVRISIATALGLSLATGAEVVGIPSVAALEAGVARYTAIGDARRETFYFAVVENGVCIEPPQLLDEAALRARLAGPVFTSVALPGFPAAAVALPRAVLLARLALEGRGIVARGDVEPLYLREPYITVAKPG